jgi:hypothetical protein
MLKLIANVKFVHRFNIKLCDTRLNPRMLKPPKIAGLVQAFKTVVICNSELHLLAFKFLLSLCCIAVAIHLALLLAQLGILKGRYISTEAR